MSRTCLFLAAYACSGLAGLIYEVSWTRLLVLYMGHGTAAVSTVVAAFMGGLALGSALGGIAAARLTPRNSLRGYVALECFVAISALVVPHELAALTPVLAWTYRDGDSGLLFPAIRLLSSLAVLALPAAALGATFPLAVRRFADGQSHPGRLAGQLYAANTAGAACGALAAGFLLIPSLGVRWTTLVGVLAKRSTRPFRTWQSG